MVDAPGKMYRAVTKSRYTRPSPRRRRRWIAPTGGAAAVIVLGVVLWYLPTGEGPKSGTGAPSDPSKSQAKSGSSQGEPLERGEAPTGKSAEPPAERAAKIQAGVEAGQRAIERNDTVNAQVQMSAALRAGATGQQATELRATLVKLANQSIFSPQHVQGDPHTTVYVVQKGDTLSKIARANKITPELIARVNNLGAKAMIREGARLKLIKGPFSVVVNKKEFTLDVYLDDIVVRTYKVGLGEHGSTPTGLWRVKNKLENPTYFPPRGGKVVQADDPNNPLGENWLGLEGVSGDAKSQERYGIHGTNEPDSIGKNSSMGCIRMHNADATELYSLLILGESQVTIND